MANELNYYGALEQTGLTVVAKVYDESGTQVGGDVSCTESGTLAIYIGDMPTATLGQYGIRFIDDSNDELLGQGVINWSGSEEIEFSLATSAEIAALNNFDPSNDTVAHVMLVDTTTTNTDMRGTDNANTVAPDEMTQAELHAGLDAYANKDDWKASNVDLSTLETKAEADARQVALIAKHDDTLTAINTLSFDDTAILNAINGLNDITVGQIRVEIATELARLDVPVSSIATTVGSIPTAIEIATAVEAAIINEGDGQQVIDAIVQLINTNLDLPALELSVIGDAVKTALTQDFKDVKSQLTMVESNTPPLS